MIDADTLSKAFLAEAAGQRQESLDHLVANLSPEEKERLLRPARSDEERHALLFLVGPVLNEISPDRRTAVFDYVENAPWAGGKFSERCSETSPNIFRLAAAMIPVAEVVKLSHTAKARYAILANTERGSSSSDLTELYIPLHRGLQTLPDVGEKETFLDLLTQIYGRDIFAMRTAIPILMRLRTNHSWDVIKRDYVQPIKEIPHDFGREPANYIWHDVPSELARSLEKLVGEDDILLLLRHLKASASHHAANHLTRTLAISLPEIIGAGLSTKHIDRYVQFAGSIADIWVSNVYSGQFVNALLVVSPEERDDVFEFAEKKDGSLSSKMYALSVGARAYACEGFAAFEKRRLLVQRINPHNDDDPDISDWILDEAEIRLRHGEKAAIEYVDAMKPLQTLHYSCGSPVFQSANYMVERGQFEFPKRVRPLINLVAYQQLDDKGRGQAISIFTELYWADVKDGNQDGSNRTDVFIATARNIGESNLERAKDFLSGGTQFPITAVLGIKNPEYKPR